MQNYHRHSCGSNKFTPDSTVFNEDYAKRAKELGHKIISSVEHGWQGKYHEVYNLSKKYDLKFIFGTEAYWVKDRTSTDKSNCHIILLAKNETGRQDINEILSIANETGYYYKPRIDLDILLGLNPGNIFITTACVAFWQYEDIEDIVLKLQERFRDDFMLEIQYHNTESQKKLNKRIKDMSSGYGIPMIVGLDSHYIYGEQATDREEYLLSHKIHYDDEDGWYMDYPSDEEVVKRFLEQGVFSNDEIKQAMNNSDIVLDFQDYDSPVFTHDRKLPTILKGKTQKEKNKVYTRLITKNFKEYMKANPDADYQKYYDGVKAEVDTYKETGMTDYPLIDYAIVKKGIEYGGIITSTGRGSAVSFFTNTLCGFSKVDRFKSPIKLYPERFMSKTRIIETNSLPDIDMNVASQEPFEKAQIEILGEDHAYPMIAFGTLKKKAAFKMYARAKNIDFEIANKVSRQISRYDEAIKYASEEEREEMTVFDFVDPEYHDLVNKSKVYWGIIDSSSKAPCSYLLYQGSIRREIGLIKCKSEATKREYITTVIDGAVAEEFKFLKNDWLVVETVLLTDKIFKRIGIEPMSISELDDAVRDNEKVWDIYAKGLTIGVNQCEKPNAYNKLVKYKPKNVSELAAFIAAIRPGFKSMYPIFESRQPFSYGIKILDDTIQTEQFPYSFILYQETLMAVLNLAGFPMDECYGIIKQIAKKHPEKVRPLKGKFIKGFKEKIKGQCPEGKTEESVAEEVWKIIDDSTSYSFNSSHALCMAYDSLYNAWQKATYPYEFYEVLLQHFTDKGKKDKVALLKQEMKNGFGIKEGPMKWGVDNTRFQADKEHNQIIPSLTAIKGMSKTSAKSLYLLSQQVKCNTFIELLSEIKSKTKVDSKELTSLVCLDYFSEFGNPNQLLKEIELFDSFYGAKQISKDKVDGLIPHDIMITMCEKETAKKYMNVDYIGIIKYLAAVDTTVTPMTDKIKYELEYLGYIQSTFPNLNESYAFITDVYGAYSNKNVVVYVLKTGEQKKFKVKKNVFESNPIEIGEIINIIRADEEGRWSKNKDGQWVQSKTNTETILKKYSMVR